MAHQGFSQSQQNTQKPVGVHSTRITFPKAPANISLTVKSRGAGLGFHGE